MMVRLLLKYLLLIVLYLSCSKEKLDPINQKVEVNPSNSFTLEITKLCQPVNSDISNVIVTNPNMKVLGSGPVIDSDGDGVVDSEEIRFQASLGINPEEIDGNGDRYDDLIIYRLGFDAESQSRLEACPNDLDQDLDFLNDCEELVIGTDPNHWDTDKDSLPDYLELFFGLNPLLSDAYLDTDKDEVLNIQEVALGMPIRSSNFDKELQQYEMKYDVSATSNVGINCWDITVSNIPLIEGAIKKLQTFIMISSGGDTNLEIYEINIEGMKAGGKISVSYEDLKAQQ